MTGFVRYIFLLLLFLSQSYFVGAQNFFFRNDSLRTLLKTQYTSISADRIKIVSELMTRQLPGEPGFDSLKNLLIEEAEDSRNRMLMCLTYDQVSKAYLSYYGRPDLYEKGKPYADKCLQVATEGGLDAYKVASYIRFARYFLNVTWNHPGFTM